MQKIAHHTKETAREKHLTFSEVTVSDLLATMFRLD